MAPEAPPLADRPPTALARGAKSLPLILPRIDRRRNPSCRRSGTHAIRAVAASAPPPTPTASGRVFNFSAGPACLPLPVLQTAQAEMLDWRGSGMSVMEMSHRGKDFMSIAAEAEQDLRSLMGVADGYNVLFVSGGASTQFAAVPMNLAGAGEPVDYINTGSWSKKATKEAARFCEVNVAAAGDGKSVPEPGSWKLNPNARYVHYCDNETIEGVEFASPPDVGNVPLVSDMSSNICSKVVDVSKFGLIYAGAQKNIGIAGVTIVIVRKDLVGNAREGTPTMLDYKTMADSNSLYNTPPCFGIYMCGLVFKHLLDQGGLAAVQEANRAKAKVLYDAIEASEGFFQNPVEVSARSAMNVPFTIPANPELEGPFMQEAAERGLVTLKGHRSVGGMRASIYNAMPVEGIVSLVELMEDFAKRHS